MIETIEGTFIRESPNRFLCEVEIFGEVHECYIPSSSRIENYLSMRNKKVLLTENKVKRRTKYSLFAVSVKEKYVIVNLNMVNSLLKNLILQGKLKDYKGYLAKNEVYTDGYKADLLLCKGEVEIIAEVKGVISEQSIVCFPQVHTERGVQQLIQLKSLLLHGKKVHYFFVSLSPFVNTIKISNNNVKYLEAISSCLELGMKIIVLQITYDGAIIKLGKRRIAFEIDEQ